MAFNVLAVEEKYKWPARGLACLLISALGLYMARLVYGATQEPLPIFATQSSDWGPLPQLLVCHEIQKVTDFVGNTYKALDNLGSVGVTLTNKGVETVLPEPETLSAADHEMMVQQVWKKQRSTGLCQKIVLQGGSGDGLIMPSNDIGEMEGDGEEGEYSVSIHRWYPLARDVFGENADGRVRIRVYAMSLRSDSGFTPLLSRVFDLVCSGGNWYPSQTTNVVKTIGAHLSSFSVKSQELFTGTLQSTDAPYVNPAEVVIRFVFMTNKPVTSYVEQDLMSTFFRILARAGAYITICGLVFSMFFVSKYPKAVGITLRGHQDKSDMQMIGKVEEYSDEEQRAGGSSSEASGHNGVTAEM